MHFLSFAIGPMYQQFAWSVRGLWVLLLEQLKSIQHLMGLWSWKTEVIVICSIFSVSTQVPWAHVKSSRWRYENEVFRLCFYLLQISLFVFTTPFFVQSMINGNQNKINSLTNLLYVFLHTHNCFIIIKHNWILIFLPSFLFFFNITLFLYIIFFLCLYSCV